MEPDPHATPVLARRIAAVDPTGSVLEASAALRRIHRELCRALGPEEARLRFDAGLHLALEQTRHLRPRPYVPAA